jgi:hypothetical protein
MIREKGGRGPIAVRVVKFELPGGEKETLVSSLLDKRIYWRKNRQGVFK